MTPTERHTWAEQELDRYASTLIETMGPNYKDHLRYKQALTELIDNPSRGAYAIITDIREAHAYFVSAK